MLLLEPWQERAQRADLVGAARAPASKDETDALGHRSDPFMWPQVTSGVQEIGERTRTAIATRSTPRCSEAPCSPRLAVLIVDAEMLVPRETLNWRGFRLARTSGGGATSEQALAGRPSWQRRLGGTRRVPTRRRRRPLIRDRKYRGALSCRGSLA